MFHVRVTKSFMFKLRIIIKACSKAYLRPPKRFPNP
jgi:hypothetical protein